MKYLLTVLVISVLSCNSTNNKPDIESMAKQYMKDSVVPQFNDPASYEYVSMRVDTLTGGKYLNALKESIAKDDTSLLGTGHYKQQKLKIADLQAIPGYKDSTLHLNIRVEYRGKNKMGGLIRDNISLVFLPNENRITLLDNIVSRY